MSTTSNLPTNREWFRRLVSGRPHQVIGGAEDPYLRRWYLIPRNPLINVYLHQFLRSDDDRALHDHPWWFVSLILRGEYEEIHERGRNWRGAGSLAFRRAEWRHRVKLVDRVTRVNGRPVLNPAPCWTLIITGRRTRSWGFWCPNWVRSQYTRHGWECDRERFIHWRDFGDAGCGEIDES
ncbi:hypothetical protein SEA_OHGEESY_62 [Gordonia phage Ohgeesy]|uniref:Uncharacterized protein n=1 Tax=Gordonia phage Ohgeesy TaxID=2762412 RepID=A0A7G8LGB9_9CAUD|nr:cysteine dioxygenase [Gordonia phage Ohgeesy]QNJ56291.1 hypothetical protein SEA_OHGEESY_62 [Gordonia phage Ohgeesy]